MIRVTSINPKGSNYTGDPIYEFLQAENISAGINRILEEGTDDDAIGILWGGRYLVRHDQPLTENYISRILGEYDLILPYECELRTGRLDGYRDIDHSRILERIISSGRIFEPGAIIGRRQLLKKLFGQIHELVGDNYCEDEILLAVYLKLLILKDSYKVKCESISKDDPEIWNNGYKRIRVLQDYFDLLLKDYVNLRKETGFEDSFAEEDPYCGDFGGKIPVWVCWWQGESEAPELVRACIGSIRSNLPDCAELILITDENCLEYVTFTDAVINKYRNGMISLTHLADVLRTELLYRYGGMWIDATYYVPRAIPEGIFSEDFYSTAFCPPLWGMDIMRGRWSSSHLACRDRHNPVMQFVMEGLWLYWEQSNEPVDYFFWDYILDLGYRKFDIIKKMIDAIPPSPPDVYGLQLKMNQGFSSEDRKWLDQASQFYKINRRNEYHKTTSFGGQTFYGYIAGGDTGKEHTPIELEAADAVSLVNALREINPYRILDSAGFFDRHCWASRGILDDVIGHPYTIDGPATDTAPVTCIYDKTGIDAPDGYDAVIV